MEDLLARHRILVCCGAGGVGKTTVAAAVALAGAQRGRRVVVVTIDPAKRLADTLGLSGLPNRPVRIEGDWEGEMWALMLDAKSTFDNLVTTYAADDAQAARILGNRFYRNISEALSGTQEYMAGEKLYELSESGARDEEGNPVRFDLVVVDTPPTRHALDFLDAPRRLTNLLDHRLYRLLTAPTRAYLKAVNLAAQAFVRTVGKVVGGEVLDDALNFFAAFQGMEEGFRLRSARVTALLHAQETAFVLVASPRRDTVEQAKYFSAKLNEMGLGVSGLIVNRAHPRFGPAGPSASAPRAAALVGTALAPLYANLADFRTIADEESAQMAGLASDIAPAPVVWIPLMANDVHDINGLGQIADRLFGG